jgi:DNA (cytosine-5)-methyltransferase 1
MIIAGDCLAGGGGVTHAMTKINNMKVIWVLNHDQMAIRTNMFNNKGIKHYWSNLYTQDEHEMEPVDFFWASVECTQFSKANGGRNKRVGSYMLAWELVRYIKFMMPFVVGIENVTEFKNWSPLKNNGQPDIKKKGQEFEKWKKTICGLGYEYHERILNAADFGIPTRRIRYFAFFTRIELGMQVNWPEPTHNKEGANGLKKWVACKDYINLINEGQSIFGREYNSNIKKGKRRKLSPNTLRRIAGGIKKYAPELYFIFQYYSSGTWLQSIDDPLRSITTKDRHVLVTLEKKEFVNNYCKVDKRQFITDGTFFRKSTSFR